MESVGTRIRRLRRDLGLPQGALAGEGLSVSYVSLIEAGKRVPSPDVLRRLAQRLNCHPEYLLECVERPEPMDFELELHYAELSLNTGAPEAALERFTAIAEQAKADDLSDIEQAAEWGKARAVESLGRLEEAVKLYERLHRTPPGQSGKRLPRLSVLVALCRVCRELGDLARGIELAEHGMAELGGLSLAASVEAIELASTLVGLYCERGDLHTADYLARTTIAQAEALDGSRALGAAYWNASLVAHRAGRSGDALSFVQRAYALYSQGNDMRALSRLRIAYATVLLGSEPPRPDEAKRYLEDALVYFEDFEGSVDAAYGASALARANLLMGETEKAITNARRGVESLGPNHRLETARANIVLASAYRQRGEEELAKETYERAALQLEASDANHQAGLVWAEFAEALEAFGERDRALWAYRESLRCLGYKRSPYVRSL
ncbi:helix-turn-helix domain-containing protein [Streptomyces cavernae]|uniref:helix-turn-helix domain-containing protein n=1 Tax=Streptomyces cavernae TaxID=2259034 RepID=UPI00139141CF|nr:helix-turn-helix domain-containing protein [Streptomyces cavernae]